MTNILLIILILILLFAVYYLKIAQNRYIDFHNVWLRYAKEQEENHKISTKQRKINIEHGKINLEQKKLNIKDQKLRLEKFKDQKLIVVKIDQKDLIDLCKKGAKK